MLEDAELILEFCTEAREYLDTMDMALLSLEENPRDREVINAAFRPIHTIKGVAGFFNLVAIGQLTHIAEDVLVAARDKGMVLRSVVIDMLFETVDILRKLIGKVQSEVNEGHLSQDEVPHEVAQLISRLQLVTMNDDSKKLGEIMVEQGTISEEDVENALQKQSDGEPGKIGEVLIRSGKAESRDVAKAIREQKISRGTPECGRHPIEKGIRVSADKLDSLVDMIGELVIAQIQVASSQTAASREQAAGSRQQTAGSGQRETGSGQQQEAAPPCGTPVAPSRHFPRGTSMTEDHDQKLSKNIEHLGKIVRELQNLTMSMHMLPIRPLFQRMERLVRDVSRKANKMVKVTLKGEETELDKKVIDALGDPLVHMLRNAVDHGLEDPEERMARGKDKVGNIYLGAWHEAGNIIIEVRDDGRGLSDVSGRGVGMDMVRKKAGSLRGVVSLETKEGEGTCFSIRLPLTMSIIDGMLVQAGKERYIFPTYCVEESLKPKKEQIFVCHGRGKVLHHRDSIIPLISLARLLGMVPSNGDRTESEEGLVIVIRDGSNRVGFFVDNLIGQQQVFIKPLGEAFQGLAGISGGAILADGRIGLILDAHGLIEYYSSH